MCLAPTAEGWEDHPVALSLWYEDWAMQPMQTPTGKIEIYSTGLAENFPEDKTRPVVPHWIEESEDLKERLSCDRAEQYPFLMITNDPRWRVHSEHDDVTWLREIKTCKVKGPDGYMYEPVWLNPIDAGKLGIAYEEQRDAATTRMPADPYSEARSSPSVRCPARCTRTMGRVSMP